MNQLTLTLACAALTLGANLAHAQAADDGKQHMHNLKALDTDGDKRLSRDEVRSNAHLSKNFDKIDTDRDGYLSPKEVKSFAKDHKGGGFNKLDKNHDNVVTRDEVANNPKLAKKFDAADTNKDGQVTKDEAKAAHGKKTP